MHSQTTYSPLREDAKNSTQSVSDFLDGRNPRENV